MRAPSDVPLSPIDDRVIRIYRCDLISAQVLDLPILTVGTRMAEALSNFSSLKSLSCGTGMSSSFRSRPRFTSD